MKTIILTFILTIISFGLFSQEFEVPKNYNLKKDADYAKYENDIIKCVDWLINTPINQQKTKRKEANAFLIKWLEGSPNVTIEIKPNIVNFLESSPDLLIIFMGGWAKNSLETRNFTDNVAGSLAGIEAVIEFYTKNKEFLKKEKNIEKYIKMKEKGSLKAYVEKNA